MIQTPLKSENPLISSQGFLPPLYSQQQQNFTFANPPALNLSNMSLSQLVLLNQQDSTNNLPIKNQQLNESWGLENNRGDQNNDTATRDFQNKLFNLIVSQNKILAELKEKNDSLQEAMAGLVNEVASLKK